MPFVDLESSDDYASIHYITNSINNNVGAFRPEVSTIVILHPLFLDSTWLDNQFGDPRLNDNYNLIAFDMRVCGRSSSRPSGLHDSWVEAADLAFCFQSLHLPPCHILALEGLSVNCALRFAALFAEMCASLTLVNIPAPTELAFVLNAYDELMQTWCYATDLESFEHGSAEAARFIVGPECDPDLQDDLIGFWERNMNPRRRTRVVEQLNVLMNRTPLREAVHKQISQPILIIHGDRNEICPKKYAERLVRELSGAQDGAILYTVKGGSSSLSIVPGHSSIVNQVFHKFLSRLPHIRTELVPPPRSISDRMKQALQTLAESTEDSSISTRDPMSSLSFCCLASVAIHNQTESLKAFREGEHVAFSPLGPDGRPLRKFSDRKDQHWFQGGNDGLSYAGTPFGSQHGKQEPEPPEKQLPLPNSEPIPVAAAHQGRLRRATVSPGSVDKQVIKGSMAKVVSNAHPNTFARMLL